MQIFSDQDLGELTGSQQIFTDADIESLAPDEQGYLKTGAKGVARGIEGIAGGIGSMTRWAGDVVGSETLSEAGKTASKFWEQAQQTGWEARDAEIFRDKFLKNPSFKRAFGIVAEAAPSLLFALMTGQAGIMAGMSRGAAAGLAAGGLGALEGAPQYEESREAGKSIHEATVHGGLSTVGTALLEYLPIGHFLKGMKGNIFTRAVRGGMEEAGQEGTQTLWQNLIAKYGYDKTRSLYEGMVESLIGGFGTGGPAGAIFKEAAPEDVKAVEQDVVSQLQQVDGKAADAIRQEMARRREEQMGGGPRTSPSRTAQSGAGADLAAMRAAETGQAPGMRPAHPPEVSTEGAEQPPAVTTDESAGGAPAIKAEAVEDLSADPIRPPGERWTADRGTMPGEPFLYLDMPDGGGVEDARAAIFEVPQETGKTLYAAGDREGNLIGEFSTVEEAAAAAEKAVPLEKTIDEPEAAGAPDLTDNTGKGSPKAPKIVYDRQEEPEDEKGSVQTLVEAEDADSDIRGSGATEGPAAGNLPQEPGVLSNRWSTPRQGTNPGDIITSMGDAMVVNPSEDLPPGQFKAITKNYVKIGFYNTVEEAAANAEKFVDYRKNVTPGLAHVPVKHGKLQQKPIIAARPIKRGKKKGWYEVVLTNYKKVRIQEDAIIRLPEVPEGLEYPLFSKLKTAEPVKPKGGADEVSETMVEKPEVAPGAEEEAPGKDEEAPTAEAEDEKEIQSVEEKAEPNGKEPWEMTRDEAIWGEYIPSGMNTERALKAQVNLWQKRYDGLSDSEKASRSSEDGIVAGLTRAKDHLEKANAHREAVQKAISEGKPVPPEVLKDYPDLADLPSAETATPSSEKAAVAQDQPTSGRKAVKATRSPSDESASSIEKAAKPIARRMVNAENDFIDNVVEQFGKTKEEASRVLDRFVKDKIVKLDPVGGRYNLKDGRFWDQDVIDRAAVPVPEKKPKPKKSTAKPDIELTNGGYIKRIGGIDYLHFKGEFSELPTQAKLLKRKTGGMPIDLLEEHLREAGRLTADESLLDKLREPDWIARRGISATENTGKLTKQEEKLRDEMQWEPEAPPEGEYIQMRAGELPQGKKLTIIDGNSTDGWDEYEVTESDPFGVTLKDGTIVELAPNDLVEVRVEDVEPTGPSLQLKREDLDLARSALKEKAVKTKQQGLGLPDPDQPGLFEATSVLQERAAKDRFTLNRIENDEEKPVTFERGEYVKVWLNAGDKYSYGRISGISHARKEFRIDDYDSWHPFAAAYKTEQPVMAEKKPSDKPAPLSNAVEKANSENAPDEGFGWKDRVYSVGAHDEFIESLYDGKVSADDVRGAFEAFQKNKDSIRTELSKLPKDSKDSKKDTLLRRLGPMGRYRSRSEKKADVIDAVLSSMEEDFVLTDGFSYMMGKRDETLRGLVEGYTDADLEAFAERVKKARAERKERIAEFKKSLENPETLEEFERFIEYRGKGALTPDQMERYDELKAESLKEERAEKEERKATLQSVGDIGMKVVKGVHTKKGHDIWTVTLDDRVDSDAFKDLRAKAKKIGGYYSRYRGGGAVPGFIFESEEAANKFMALREGEVSVADETAERQGEAREKAVQRLRNMADGMEASGRAALSADRRTNTARRARMAASAEAGAQASIAFAKTLRGIADAIEDGRANHLEGLRTKVQLEELESLLGRAKHDAIIDSQKTDKSILYEDVKDRPPTIDDVRFAEFPRYAFYADILRSVANDLDRIQGGKGLALQIRSRVKNSGQHDRVSFDSYKDSQIIENAYKKLGKNSVWGLADAVEKRARLKKMGIETDEQLRAALRELVEIRAHKKGADPLKQAERALIGKNVGIDFFPTPKSIIDRMVEEAGIEPGMTALEPSAGKGDIADAMKEAGAEVDTVEVSEALRDILKLKGHNIAGRDFMDFEGEYDRILMNPPFSKLQDIDHVQRAYEMLNPGGRLVAIMSESPFFRSDKKASNFREWLDERGWSERLPQGTFKGKEAFRETGVASRMVVIDKPGVTTVPGSDSDLKAARNTQFSTRNVAEDLDEDALRSIPGVKRVTKSGKGFFRLHFPNGMSVPLRVVKQVADGKFHITTRKKIAGKYEDFQIEIVQGVGGRWTVSHELEHWLEDIGIIDKTDIAALNRAARQSSKKLSEARADLVADLMMGRAEQRNTVLGKIAQKIGDFLDALVNTIRRTARGVARDIESGNLFGKPMYRGMGLRKNLYAGKKAKTHDQTALSDAVATYLRGTFLKTDELKRLNELMERFESLTEEEKAEFSALADRDIEGFGDLNDAIRKKTGWFRGIDKKWRFEIDDSNIKMTGKKVDYLENIVEHPILFDAYPDLKNVLVNIHTSPEHAGKNSKGGFAPGTPGTDKYFGKDPEILILASSIKEAEPILVHEIQHAIQHIEGFATGGTPWEFDAEEMAKEPWGKTLQEKQFYQYQRLAGEIEARDAALRLGMSAEGRKMVKPYEMEGIPLEAAIVRFSDKGLMGSETAQFSTVAEATETLRKDYAEVFKFAARAAKNLKKGWAPQKGDTSLVDRILSLPTHHFQKVGGLKRMLDAALERSDDYYNMIHDMDLTQEGESSIKQIETLKKQRPEEYAKLREYLIQRDRDQIGNRIFFDEKFKKFAVKDLKGKVAMRFDKEAQAIQFAIGREAYRLKEAGYSDQAVEALIRFREVTNRGFDILMQGMRDIILKYQEAGMPLPVTRVNVNGEIKEIDLKVALAEMGDRRGYYFPRIRKPGRYVLRATKDGVNPIMEFYDSKARMAIRQTALEKKGYSVTKDLSPKVGEDVFEMAGEVVAMQAMINEALDRAGKEARTEESMKEVRKILDEVELTFAKVLAEQVANVIRTRGHRSRMTRRSEATGTDVWIGYEEDPSIALAKYVRGISAGEAKKRMALKMVRAFTGTDIGWQEFRAENSGAKYADYIRMVQKRRVDPSRQPNAFKEGKVYMQDMLRNDEFIDRTIGTIKGLAVLKYLAGRVSAPVVNLTALVTSAPAAMNGYGDIPIFKSMKLIGKAAKLYGQYQFGDRSKLDKGTIALFDQIREKGWHTAQYNKEALSVLKSKLGRGWDNVMEWSMIMFSSSEHLNRVSTIAGAYMGIQEHNPMSHEDALALAKKISDRAHGVYGKANRPFLARGANPAAQVAQAFYVFRTFSHNYLLTMKELGLDEKNARAALFMAFSPAILAGAGASVATPILAAIAKALGADDPEEDFYKWAEVNFGGGASNLARFGLAGMGGHAVSLKGSLAIGVTDLPTSISDILGAPGSVIGDVYRGGKNIIRGDVWKGTENIMPLFVSSAMKAYRESTEGVTTRSNAPVFYGRDQLKLDTIDAVLRFLSFNPAEIAGKRERQWHEFQVEDKYRGRRRDLYAKLKRFYLQPVGKRARADYIDLMGEIRNYNTAAKKKGQTVITEKSIRSNLRRNFRPSKAEKKRAA